MILPQYFHEGGLGSWIPRPRLVYITHGILHYWIHRIAIEIYNTTEQRSREPSLGLVPLWFGHFSVSFFPEVLEDFVNAIDVTNSGLSANPIDYDRPFKRIKVALRLGEDLVGCGGRTSCDETRQTTVWQIGLDRPELVFGGKCGDNLKVERERALGMAWGI